jgi:uncharacterized membrane protein YeaQ/YmgE (transglycosylase-associated protein family)
MRRSCNFGMIGEHMSWLITLVTEAMTEFIVNVLAEWVRAVIVEAIATFFTEIVIGLIAEWVAETVTALFTELATFVRRSLAVY